MSGDVQAGERLVRDRIEVRARIAGLQADLDRLVAAAADTNGDDEHDPEGATIAYEREQSAALLAAARRRLDDIDAAIGRIEGGVYGRCVECGRPIDLDRLAARPTSTRCRTCA